MPESRETNVTEKIKLTVSPGTGPIDSSKKNMKLNGNLRKNFTNIKTSRKKKKRRQYSEQVPAIELKPESKVNVVNKTENEDLLTKSILNV